VSRDVRIITVAILLAAVTIAVYFPAGGYREVSFDDNAYVFENSRVNQGLTREGVGWAFSNRGYASNWHPLTWLSHMLDVELFGLQPGRHHLVNIVIHAAAAILVLLFFSRATGALWPSAATTALFALHPLHVESVAWIAERKDVLSGFFWMLTLLLYLRYARRPGLPRYLAVLLAFCCALLSKPMAVTLPFVLLLLDYWPLGRLGAPPRDADSAADTGGRSWPAVVVEKIPLLLLSFALAAVTYVVQSTSGSAALNANLSLGVRLANAATSYLGYLGKMVWPTRLSVIYLHTETSPPPAVLALALVTLAAVTLAALLWRKRLPHLGVGWFWYLGTLVPAIGIVQVGRQAMADRYTYLPLVGIFVALCWSVPGALRRSPSRRVLVASATLAALLVLAIVSRRQVQVWRDTETLFSRAIELDPANDVAHNSLALHLHRGGNLERARWHYQEAIRLRPGNSEPYVGLGVISSQLGLYREEASWYRQALAVDPLNYRAWKNLREAYVALGDEASVLKTDERIRALAGAGLR